MDKIHRLKKKKKQAKRHVFTELFPLPLPEQQVGVARASLKVATWAKRKECDYQAHVRSNLQHKYKYFTEAQYERDFNPLGALAALLDICDLSDILPLESPAALGCSLECVLKGVAPADSELTCSTEQCCTEYLWHWNSCEFFYHHRCLEGSPIAVCVFLQHLGCVHTAIHHVLVDSCHLSSTWKHRHVLQILADVTMAQSIQYEVW